MLQGPWTLTTVNGGLAAALCKQSIVDMTLVTGNAKGRYSATDDRAFRAEWLLEPMPANRKARWHRVRPTLRRQVFERLDQVSITATRPGMRPAPPVFADDAALSLVHHARRNRTAAREETMSRRDLLTISFTANLCALALIVVASALALLHDPMAGQEQFETVAQPAEYAARMVAAADGLRQVLFVDALFMIAYTVAVGFAVLAFAGNNRAAAWFGGIGIVLVLGLDILENAVMTVSTDIVAAGGQLAMERIAGQATVSALKWQTAAAVLFAISFVLPSRSALEKLLVWGVRIGLPVAAPLFITGAFSLRGAGGLLLLVSMAGGFILLAAVTRSHARQA